MTFLTRIRIAALDLAIRICEWRLAMNRERRYAEGIRRCEHSLRDYRARIARLGGGAARA